MFEREAGRGRKVTRERESGLQLINKIMRKRQMSFPGLYSVAGCIKVVCVWRLGAGRDSHLDFRGKSE